MRPLALNFHNGEFNIEKSEVDSRARQNKTIPSVIAFSQTNGVILLTAVLRSCFILILVFYTALLNAQPFTKEQRRPQLNIIHFDLPRQSLQVCLVEFALQANVNLIVPNEIVSGFFSEPVIGAYTAENALTKILANTPLKYRFLKHPQALLIEPVAKNDVSPSSANNVILEEVTVRGVQYPFYYSTIRASSQVHNNLSTFDTARYINVLPKQLVIDQHPDDLSDVLRYSSGITPADGLADSNDDFFIRGFPRNALYIDGFRLEQNNGIKIRPATIENIEIVKGPSTLFYGQAEPGGIVNIIRKKPRLNGQNTVSISTGSGNLTELYSDLNSPAFLNNRALTRVIVEKQRQSEFRDWNSLEHELIAPSLSWQFSQATSFNVGAELQRISQIREQGAIVLTPESNNVNLVGIKLAGRQAQPNFDSSFALFNAEFTHHINRDWNIRGKFFRQRENRQGVRGRADLLLSDDILIESDNLNPDIITIPIGGMGIEIPVGTEISSGEDQFISVATLQSLYDERGKTQAQLIRFSLDGTADTGAITHHLAAGIDQQQERLYENFTLEERHDIRQLSLSQREQTTALDQIEAVVNSNPNLGELSVIEQRIRNNDYGIYAQDTVEFNEYWLASIGARYTVTNAKLDKFNQTATIDLNRYEALSSQLGLIYKPSASASWYLNYSEAMRANYQFDDIGTAIDKPELSEQLELGLKSFLLNGKFLSTFSLFSIDKNNIVNINFEEGKRVASLGGKQQINGLDLDFSYQVSRSLNIIASASYLDPKITTGANRNNQPKLVTNYTGSIFLNYQIKQGEARELSFNFGSYTVGDRFVENNNHTEIPGVTVFDAGISYRYTINKTNAKFQINVRNLTDELYFSAVEGAIRTNRGSGRTTTATLAFYF